MSATTYTQVPIEDFDKVLGTTSAEISSVSLGGRILSCSDEWFAPASDLLKVHPAPSLKGTFGPKGALFDGWETRRHCPTFDWVILRLGPASGGHVVGFDVDTANFNGNEAPEVEIFGLSLSPEEEKQIGDKVSDTDSRRHLYSLSAEAAKKSYTHIKLHMIPDGGIARFRVYGIVAPPAVGYGTEETINEKPELNTLDLAHVLNGGRVVYTNDAHFGKGSNLILPGRGKDMGDGWETKRSRGKDHKDTAIIKLGEEGYLNYVEVDTAHFLGNYPQACEVFATNFGGLLPGESAVWTPILARTKLGPGRRHFFDLINAEVESFTHIKLHMIPDGGIKRIRVVGRRSAPLGKVSSPLPKVALPKDVQDPIPGKDSSPFVSVGPSGVTVGSESRFVASVPLTSDGFAKYGNVIATPPREENKPFKIVNQGTAKKFVTLSPVTNNYPIEAEANTNVHIYHCDPIDMGGKPFHVKLLERHRFTTQAFLPMTPSGKGQEGYLVVVAQNGEGIFRFPKGGRKKEQKREEKWRPALEGDRPDLSTLTVFLATTEQGISYHPGIWHHPMIALGSAPTDFACVVNESDLQPQLDCDEVEV
ncbi:Allantoicase [Violaceomyces palustris]|uniref:Allantoicase n=1 Tax=Violaceomyces palustris TaxID=1673888 RepID=A0ACD0P0V3_9BASI|nr:Allantoicase [Violaceomyces palustris]